MDREKSEQADPVRFGSYEVDEVLGEGSFGRTFLVHDRNVEASPPYALKWLKSSAESGADKRFENEAWALENFDHPAFPKLIHRGKERDRPYLVMTYAEGKTIGKRINENVKEGTAFSSLSVLLIAQKLLEALSYLDKFRYQNSDGGFMHRDIKDENVIVSSSGGGVSLIDLGLCKGPVLPAQDNTFWNAGAARFAPPAKLDNAASSIISHDVFAVGVLCYRMLTNVYPWEVPSSQGVGDLKAKMLRETPVSIQDLNNKVDHRISDLIMRMLEVHDYARIVLETAVDDTVIIRQSLEAVALPNISKGPPLRLSRVVRDPVHGDIQMTDLEFAVLNCREMQRLRRIRQLGTTHLVYPGAEHSRLAHAIGVVHTVERILRAIEMRNGKTFSDEERWTARMSALVHDIAHAPFGHTLEDELGFFSRHDKNPARLNRMFGAEGAEIPAILQATEVGRAVIDLLFQTLPASSRWIETLLSGSVGADVLDYVDRDSYYCGLDNRIDSAIFRRFMVDRFGSTTPDGKEILPRLYGNHGFRLDADYAVLSVLEARYAMFLKVYSHPVKTAAGAMIGKAFSLARASAPDKFREEVVEILGDEELLSLIEAAGTPTSQMLIRAYRDRKLFRPAFRANIMQNAALTPENYRERRKKLDSRGLFDPARRLELETELALEARIAPEEIILYANPKAPGAKSVSQRVEQSRGDVQTRDGVFSRHQDIFSRHLGLWNLYLFTKPDLEPDIKSRLSMLMKRRFELSDEGVGEHKQLAFRM